MASALASALAAALAEDAGLTLALGLFIQFCPPQAH